MIVCHQSSTLRHVEQMDQVYEPKNRADSLFQAVKKL
jgi:hypothetical protein